MDTQKKAYTSPELIEHGDLAEITQDGCLPGVGDTVDYTEFTSDVSCW